MKNFVQRNFLFNTTIKKNFSVLPKNMKMELTMRTPYRTFFEKFNGFTRVYVGTIKGQIGIGNRTYPAIYILPAGQIKVVGVSGAATGNMCEQGISGDFIHSGGYCMVHE
jgi:hypothetical protein